MEKRQLFVLWGILALLLIIAVILGPKVVFLPTKDFGIGDVTKLLGRFFVLALFVERTLEVFITAWRGEKTVKLEQALKNAKASLQSPPDQPVPQEVKEAAEKLAEYKCETQSIALRSGLVLGILIAAVGVRSFNVFIDESKIQWVYSLHKYMYNFLDILISGGIIGGGSEAIHKLMNVITEFLDATAKRVKNPQP